MKSLAETEKYTALSVTTDDIIDGDLCGNPTFFTIAIVNGMLL